MITPIEEEFERLCSLISPREMNRNRKIHAMIYDVRRIILRIKVRVMPGGRKNVPPATHSVAQLAEKKSA